jgi:hypothetical protein
LQRKELAVVAAFRTVAATSIDTELLAATGKLGEILTVVARRAPLEMAQVLQPELSIVVFPKDGQAIPFRVRFVSPAKVVVIPGDVPKPRTRIALTKQALRHWVRGTLDVRDAVTRRTFIVAGDPAPFHRLARILSLHGTADAQHAESP